MTAVGLLNGFDVAVAPVLNPPENPPSKPVPPSLPLAPESESPDDEPSDESSPEPTNEFPDSKLPRINAAPIPPIPSVMLAT